MTLRNPFSRVAMIGLAIGLGAGLFASASARPHRPNPTIGADLPALRPVLDGVPSSRPAVRARAVPRSVERSLGSLFPAQMAAQESPGDPASYRWALLIGINEYAGGTEDAVGSRQDAEELRKIMLHRGWPASHIMMLRDSRATASRIVQSMRWLASKTTKRSVVVFHYAGHEMPFYADPDGDGEGRDVAIWATDNRFVMDSAVGRELGKVHQKRMWIHFATCRAGGFNDPGTRKRNRVITYSSPVDELSYEDPSVSHSVMGYFTIVKGLRSFDTADRNGDGRISVEEAFAFANSRVRQRTDDRQHPFMVDKLEGGFRLWVPKPKDHSKPPPPPEPDCGLPVCI